MILETEVGPGHATPDWRNAARIHPYRAVCKHHDPYATNSMVVDATEARIGDPTFNLEGPNRHGRSSARDWVYK